MGIDRLGRFGSYLAVLVFVEFARPLDAFTIQSYLPGTCLSSLHPAL